MTVRELKRAIEDLDDHVEVRIAEQPHWPFEYEISEVAVVSPRREHYEVVLGEPWSDTDDTNGWYLFDPNEETEETFGPFDTIDEANAKLDSLELEGETVVYLAEGKQLAYLPSAARRELCW